MKRINNRMLDLTTTRDGRVVSTEHCTVSTNGKTTRCDIRAVDAQGKRVRLLLLSDKQ
jgi:hypothetical protein